MIYSCITLADNTGGWNSPGSKVAPQVAIDKLKRRTNSPFGTINMSVDEMTVSVCLCVFNVVSAK